MRPIALPLLLPLVLCAATSAGAADIESAYTSVDLEKDCMILNTEEEVEENQGAEFICKGYGRVAVWVGEGDLRLFVGYGARGRDTCSYRQTFSAFNNINKTLEWRIRKENGKSRPFATILRYFITEPTAKKAFLVVTKVGRGEACQMAYIDTKHPNHNDLAREAADRFAPTFDCKAEKPFGYGPGGKEPAGGTSTATCN